MGLHSIRQGGITCYAESFLPSLSRTTTTTGADRPGNIYSSLVLTTDVTVNAGGLGSITVTIQGKDANGIYYTILASAAITAVATSKLVVAIGAPVTANVSANEPLPATWRVVVTANNANPMTYSVGLNLQS